MGGFTFKESGTKLKLSWICLWFIHSWSHQRVITLQQILALYLSDFAELSLYGTMQYIMLKHSTKSELPHRHEYDESTNGNQNSNFSYSVTSGYWFAGSIYLQREAKMFYGFDQSSISRLRVVHWMTGWWSESPPDSLCDFCDEQEWIIGHFSSKAHLITVYMCAAPVAQPLGLGWGESAWSVVRLIKVKTDCGCSKMQGFKSTPCEIAFFIPSFGIH